MHVFIWISRYCQGFKIIKINKIKALYSCDNFNIHAWKKSIEGYIQLRDNGVIVERKTQINWGNKSVFT